MSNLIISIEPELVIISANKDTVLTELSFGIEAAVSNFLGRGVTRMHLTKEFTANGLVVRAKALMPAGPMQLSKAGTLVYAIQEGLFPRRLKDEDSFMPPGPFATEKIIKDGQNKIKQEGWTESVIESRDLDVHITLATIAYGLSDMFMGVFAMGSPEAKWQGSQRDQQFWFKHRESDDKILNWLRSNQDYNIHQTVGELS